MSVCKRINNYYHYHVVASSAVMYNNIFGAKNSCKLDTEIGFSSITHAPKSTVHTTVTLL